MQIVIQADSNIGKAYIYRLGGKGWIEEAILLDSNGNIGDRFGGSVFVSGEQAIVGAESAGETGAAYIYRFGGSGWVEEATLSISDQNGLEEFGSSVAIENDIAVIGADRTEENGVIGSGSAYVFRFINNQWTETDKLIASDNSLNAAFGFSVAISDTNVLVGAVHGNGVEDDSGTAYVFEISTSCPGDTDNNGVVNIADLLTLIAFFGTDEPVADLDDNGIVNVADILILIANFGSCP